MRHTYVLDNGSPVNGTFNPADHSGTGSVVPTTYGPHEVRVRSIDGAGNASDRVAYQLYANAPNTPVAHWRFDEGGGTWPHRGLPQLAGRPTRSAH